MIQIQLCQRFVITFLGKGGIPLLHLLIARSKSSLVLPQPLSQKGDCNGNTEKSEEDDLQSGDILRAARVNINHNSRSKSPIKTSSNALKSIGYTAEDQKHPLSRDVTDTTSSYGLSEVELRVLYAQNSISESFSAFLQN